MLTLVSEIQKYGYYYYLFSDRLLNYIFDSSPSWNGGQYSVPSCSLLVFHHLTAVLVFQTACYGIQSYNSIITFLDAALYVLVHTNEILIYSAILHRKTRLPPPPPLFCSTVPGTTAHTLSLSSQDHAGKQSKNMPN